MSRHQDIAVRSSSSIASGSVWHRAWLLPVAALVLAAAAGAKPQSEPYPRHGTTIALVDLKEVFDQHPGFLRRMQQLKAAVEAAEASFKVRRAEIETIQQRLGAESMPRAQREELETQVRESTQSLSLEITLAKKVYSQREAAIYASTYQEVCQVVRAYMHEAGIDVVIRSTHSEASDPTKNIKNRLNAPIIAFADHLDITQAIIGRCVRREQLANDEGPVDAPPAE